MKSFLLLLLLPCFMYGQKLKVNEVDKFTGQKRLETNSVSLKARLSEGIGIYFRAIDSSLFVIIGGFGAGATTIAENDKALFLLEDGTTVTAYSTGLQSYEIHSQANSYNHQYRITKEDLRNLSLQNTKSIRCYSIANYVDVDIPKKHQDDIKGIADLMLKSL